MPRFRILVLQPPTGVAYALQRGRDGLVPPTTADPHALRFDFGLRTGKPLADGRPNFLGDFAQGTPHERFVYLRIGKLAGQADSCWERRAKVMLGGIDAALWSNALATGDGALLQARFAGRGRDGGPACARVPLLDGGWRLLDA